MTKFRFDEKNFKKWKIKIESCLKMKKKTSFLFGFGWINFRK